MKKHKNIRALLIEDDPKEVEQFEKVFSSPGETAIQFQVVTTLAEAVELIESDSFAGSFDIILLDLGLPDSVGVSTFERIHALAPEMPVLVLTGADGEALAEQAVEQGAQDYLVKQQIAPTLLSRSIRYAIDRSSLQQALAEKRQQEQQEREFIGIDRLSKAPGTAVTASMYSGNPIRDTAPEAFESMVTRYRELLSLALENRIFKVESNGSEAMRQLADDLGFLRATPRDVVEIHSDGLKGLVDDVPWQKAQAYLQEGRLTVLELMGYLTAFYRNHYPARKRNSKAQ